jgi:hypothetical protein
MVVGQRASVGEALVTPEENKEPKTPDRILRTGSDCGIRPGEKSEFEFSKNVGCGQGQVVENIAVTIFQGRSWWILYGQK